MVNFKLEKTAIYKALILDKIPFFHWSGFFKDLFLLLSIISGVFITLEFYFKIGFPFLIYGVLFFSLFLIFLEINLFFDNYIKNPKTILKLQETGDDYKKVNIAEFLDFESAKIIDKAQKIGNVDSYLFLFSFLKYSNSMDFVFYRTLIDKRIIIDELGKIFNKRKDKEEVYSDSFLKIIEEAFLVAKNRGNEKITPEDIFVSLSDNNSYLQGIFYEEGLKKKDLIELTSWQLRLKKKDNPLVYNNLIKKGKLGIEWASGYTPILDRFSIDWTERMKFLGFPEPIGHEEELESLERVLSRTDTNNPLLVGEPGSGRRSIIQGIIRKSYLGESLSGVNFKRFLELNLSLLISITEGVEETESLLDRIFNEAATAGNVVLIINNFHNFVGQENRMGVLNISGVLDPYLHLPEFKVIGITSYEGYRNTVENNTEVSHLMEKIEVGEVGKEETLLLLEKETLYLEKKYHKLISFSALVKIVDLSDRYIKDHPFPEKAIDLLKETVIHVHQNNDNILLPKHIEKIVSEKTEIPVGDIDEKEREILLNMENLLKERIVSQEEAVKAVSFGLRRSRAEVSTRRSLIGSFLFLGPTGVGKTEMGKAIADIYFGSKKKINRVDMSEFQTHKDVSRLIGSKKEEGILTLNVREDPFSLILLDEIEKAHPDVLNIFLQVLDEGHLTDGSGRKVDFKNSMLIATSNAGYNIILDAIENKENWGKTKEKILRRLFQRGIFRPEFINRFDEVVLFKPLTKEDLFIICGIQLNKMALELKKKDMNFKVTDELKKKIVEISYDPFFGAREMQRAIQNNIGDSLSSAILKEEIGAGDSFVIDSDTFILKKE